MNESLLEMDFFHQVITIATKFAGRDMQNGVNGERIEKASTELIDTVYEALEGQLTGLDKLWAWLPLSQLVLHKCDLQLDKDERIEIYYKGKKIGITRFNYTPLKITKEYIENLFKRSMFDDSDMVLCIYNEKINLTRFEIYKHADLGLAFMEFDKKYDDMLMTKNRHEYVVDAIKIKFPFIATEP